MKYILCIILFFFVAVSSEAQNCNAFLYLGDTCQYEACQIALARRGHYQFSKVYQDALIKATEHCPRYSHAYRHQSVAYLKSGDFLNWKRLIDLAVRYNPEEHLGYRGWCRYQFFRDYRGAIADIERLDSLINYDIGHSANGDYHLNIAKALCYKALGQQDTAITIIEKQLQQDDHLVGIYDYLHLGVLYFEIQAFDKAISCFQRQAQENDLAENQFYWGKVMEAIGQNGTAYFKQALLFYQEDRRLFDPYTHPMDQVYLETIKNQLKEME